MRQRRVRTHVYFEKFMRRKNRKLTKHHDQPRSLGGTFEHENIYMLSAEHHQAYHKLFGLRTFAQAAEVLMRMEKMHTGGA